jgi:hypothetical protein
VPEDQKEHVEVEKWFKEAILFTETTGPAISNEKYSIVDDTWQLAIEAQDCQRASTGDPVDTPSACQLPCSPSLTMDLQSRQAVSVNTVFCSLIGLMIILNPKNIHP